MADETEYSWVYMFTDTSMEGSMGGSAAEY
jgi:hypothetical protein